jgi:hypothetical protein
MKFLSGFFLFFIFYFLFFISPVLADEPPTPTPTPLSWVDNLTPQTLEKQIQEGKLSSETKGVFDTNVLTLSLVRLVVGPFPEENNTTSYVPGGALGGVTTLIAALYARPPASGVEYLADLGTNLGLVPKAYAQGIGFEGLRPILPIWKAFRNIAYLFFVIVFIVMGFAIMFRMKISPQAVLTVQAALPRVVIALILVTFSYAIAGFLIDLMYLGLTLGIVLLGAGGLFTPQEIPQLQEQFLSGGFPQVIGAAFNVAGTSLFAGFGLIGAAMGAALGAIVGRIMGGVLAPVGALIGGVGGGLLMMLILTIIILYILFKLFFELIKAYIGIVMGVIFGPLQIMLGVLPGQKGFGGWLVGLLANILVFPAVAMVLLIGRVLIHRGTSGGTFWTPPMMLSSGGAFSVILPAIFGLGILLLVHKVPEMVHAVFQIKPAPYGAAIGEAIGAPGRVVGYPVKVVKPVSQTLTSIAGGLRAIPDIRAGIKGLRDKEVAPGADSS